MKKVLTGLVLLALMALVGCDGSIGATDKTIQPDHKAQIEFGRYLTKAADCAACHTTSTGAPFAGGVELASPFGKFYGSNITPDKEHGIGKWSADQFYKALHDGVTPDKHLYPAMPYTSYRGMTRADSDAIYAFLMQQKAVAVATRPADLKFPYNMRFGMMFWNVLFLKNSLNDASVGQSASWQRGQYLSNVMGHCAECHTPRGLFGQLDLSKSLTGAALARVAAPNVTPAGLAAVGWNPADLQTFLASGIAPQGSAYGDMFPVVHLSTQYLSKDDLVAVTTYLFGDKPLVPEPVKAIALDTAELKAGQRLYTAVCAGCHGFQGEGKPHVAVPMQGNSTVRNADSHNLIVTILDGVEAQKFPGIENLQEMPGFATTLSDQELAQLTNFLRAQWGGHAASVTPEQVKGLKLAAGTK
ncbi:c-type cytochrome [Solimicrobium silvestre]|uniref:Cytochrome C oxidase, cbb3-type, subunit III n=1 Tax=Solimicrobium silvestre TaxID=2099400 RepID=A0A2S9H242_9BURK|nr:c-type cytochrome [Solimicrobium silvestre]PRC93936.1 Cytochrome C oxidase, cbb3-type, subunit III [Solimicrobium silvestre]